MACTAPAQRTIQPPSAQAAAVARIFFRLEAPVALEPEHVRCSRVGLQQLSAGLAWGQRVVFSAGHARSDGLPGHALKSRWCRRVRLASHLKVQENRVTEAQLNETTVPCTRALTLLHLDVSTAWPCNPVPQACRARVYAIVFLRWRNHVARGSVIHSKAQDTTGGSEPLIRSQRCASEAMRRAVRSCSNLNRLGRAQHAPSRGAFWHIRFAADGP